MNVRLPICTGQQVEFLSSAVVELSTITQVYVCHCLCLFATDQLLGASAYIHTKVIMQLFVTQMLNFSIYLCTLSVSHLVNQSVCLSVCMYVSSIYMSISQPVWSVYISISHLVCVPASQ